MFLGDMALYYDKGDYDSNDALNEIIRIMKKVPTERLYIGGMLGPFCAFLHCIGYYHVVLLVQEKFSLFGWICFLILSSGIIFGGVYHSHCANLGLIFRHENKECSDEVNRYLGFQRYFVFGIMAIGNMMLGIMIVLGMTPLPNWMILFSPTVLIFVMPLLKKLPKGLHMVIAGGWTNLVTVIYYLFALALLSF